MQRDFDVVRNITVVNGRRDVVVVVCGPCLVGSWPVRVLSRYILFPNSKGTMLSARLLPHQLTHTLHTLRIEALEVDANTSQIHITMIQLGPLM